MAELNADSGSGGGMDGIIAAGGDFLSSVTSGLFGSSSAKRAAHRARQMAMFGYRAAANDLEKAGLNRVIALGNPTSVGMSPTASMPPAKMGSSYVAGKLAQQQVASAKQAIAQSQAETELKKVQTVLMGEQARLTSYEADKQEVLKLGYQWAADAIDDLKRWYNSNGKEAMKDMPSVDALPFDFKLETDDGKK